MLTAIEFRQKNGIKNSQNESEKACNDLK